MLLPWCLFTAALIEPSIADRFTLAPFTDVPQLLRSASLLNTFSSDVRIRCGICREVQDVATRQREKLSFFGCLWVGEGYERWSLDKRLQLINPNGARHRFASPGVALSRVLERDRTGRNAVSHQQRVLRGLAKVSPPCYVIGLAECHHEHRPALSCTDVTIRRGCTRMRDNPGQVVA